MVGAALGQHSHPARLRRHAAAASLLLVHEPVQALTRFRVIALAACHQPGTSEPGGTAPPSDSGTTSQGPLEIRSVAPTLGSVAGGTRLVVTGAGWTPGVKIFVGDVPC